MADAKFKLEEMREGKDFAAGDTHRVTVLGLRRLRITGMFFDLNKCFLLPSAMPGIQVVKEQYEKHPNANLLIVGHTDTSDSDENNLNLSLERSDSMAAYLSGNVAAWDAFFQETKPFPKRWGSLEIQLMLTVLPGDTDPKFYPGKPNGLDDAAMKSAVKAFQADQELKVDGICGPVTRKALIEQYMTLDATKLPASITAVAHGAGESFPAVDAGDGNREKANRRVELFFFDGPIEPAPAADKKSRKGSTQYPEWLKQVTETVDIAGGDAPKPVDLKIRLHDADANPMKNVSFRVTIGGKAEPIAKSADGFAEIKLPGAFCPLSVGLEWGDQLPDGSFAFQTEVFVECEGGEERQEAAVKLANLGYPSQSDAEYLRAVKNFQRDYQTGEDGLAGGKLPPATRSKLTSIFGDTLDATRPPLPPDPQIQAEADAATTGSCFDA